MKNAFHPKIVLNVPFQPKSSIISLKTGPVETVVSAVTTPARKAIAVSAPPPPTPAAPAEPENLRIPYMIGKQNAAVFPDPVFEQPAPTTFPSSPPTFHSPSEPTTFPTELATFPSHTPSFPSPNLSESSTAPPSSHVDRQTEADMVIASVLSDLQQPSANLFTNEGAAPPEVNPITSPPPPQPDSHNDNDESVDHTTASQVSQPAPRPDSPQDTSGAPEEERGEPEGEAGNPGEEEDNEEEKKEEEKKEEENNAEKEKNDDEEENDDEDEEEVARTRPSSPETLIMPTLPWTRPVSPNTSSQGPFTEPPSTFGETAKMFSKVVTLMIEEYHSSSAKILEHLDSVLN